MKKAADSQGRDFEAEIEKRRKEQKELIRSLKTQQLQKKNLDYRFNMTQVNLLSNRLSPQGLSLRNLMQVARSLFIRLTLHAAWVARWRTS